MHKHLLHDSLIHIRSKKKKKDGIQERFFSGFQSGFRTTFQDVGEQE